MTDGNTGDEIGVVQGTVLTVVDTVGSDANDNPPVGEPTLSITDVNGDNNIVSNGVIAVNGTFPAPVTAASIDGYALTVASQTATTVTLTPFNVFNSTRPFGAGVLTLDDGTTQDTQAITLSPATGTQYVVVAGVQPYLAAGLDVADGDQMACDTAVAGSTMTLSANTDVVYSPAAPDGVVHNRHWYDVTTSTWDSGTVRVDRPGAVANPPVWRATPNPPAASIGVPYSYAIGGLLDGKRPMTLTDAGAALPAGLSYDDSAYPETITGTPTVSGAVAGIVTRADNGE